MRRWVIIVLSVLLLCVTARIVQLCLAATSPVDGVLVLGGTPNRERYAAQLTLQEPSRITLISGGSQDPCIWLIYNKAKASKEHVWTERCSHNTLENFIFSTPILNKLNVHKVLLVADDPQSERALPMAQIILGSHGMAVELRKVPDSSGEPLKRPVWQDVALAMCWAVPSQFYQPTCMPHKLNEIDMKYWYQQGFYCAPQAEVDNYRPDLN